MGLLEGETEGSNPRGHQWLRKWTSRAGEIAPYYKIKDVNPEDPEDKKKPGMVPCDCN